MKATLTTLCFYLSLTAYAQTVVESMQTANNDKVLSINIVGKRDGQTFRHTLRFDVTGLSQAQRDSLLYQSRRILNMLDVDNVPPGLLKSSEEIKQESAVTSDRTTFRYENCTGRGRIEVYGDNWLSTRQFNTRRDRQPLFPLTMRLAPGDYRYRLRRNGTWRTEESFTVKAGEDIVVILK